jgi:hypothetical protein
VFQSINYKQKRGKLRLASSDRSGAFMGVKTTSGTYNATVKIRRKASAASGGLGINGDDENIVSVICRNDQ